MKTKQYVSSFIVLALTACGGPQNSDVIFTGTENAIVGGRETTRDNILSKYVVLIVDNPTKKNCTGLLISKRMILTAAHCVGTKAEDLSLAFGLNPLSGNYTLRKADKIFASKQYDKNSSQNRHDLGLILIKGTAPEGYLPLLLPDEKFPLLKGLAFTAVGYGRTSGKSTPQNDIQGSGVLRHVELKIDSLNSDETQFFVDQRSGKGICNGDSGGPALMRYMERDYVVGIASAVSWSVPDEISAGKRNQYIQNKDVCAEKSIYMNVKKFRSWIDTHSKQLLN
ncbi:trypsin-like serine protease [Bdellovibrio sp. 22V]|uniref:S1 family peptidase n=1 Tax=Bdellovibrio TaxID=958 RepID=UPI002543F4F1|nr:trypsin-like serine protease [Bdellovibrio sp. 22V]WII72472.1 trypsin-like serine protease [Bdellovibrio sp. 22V]